MAFGSSTGYFRWSTDNDIQLVLSLVGPTGAGATGLSPEVAIRRYRLLDGTISDLYYWNGTTFVSSPTWLTMVAIDAVENPGAYAYLFDQSTVATEFLYLVYYRHTVSPPVGFATELHLVSNEVFIPSAAAPMVPVVPGDTVMGRLALMEDPTEAVALANADAVWDEILNQHLLPGSTGEALAGLVSAQIGSEQVNFTVEDTGAAPLQGAQLDIFDITNTFFITRVWTDVLGQAQIGLDIASYAVRILKNGYSFTTPQTLVVAGSPTDVTYVGTLFGIIVPPTDPTHCKIFGYIRDVLGNPIAGACVQAFSVTPQVVGGFQHADEVAAVYTNSDGYFEVELVRLTTVRISVDGTDVDYERVVPDAPVQDLTTWTA